MKLSKGYTEKPYQFLVNDKTLPSDNPLRFRKNLRITNYLFLSKSKQSKTKLTKAKLNII